MSINWWKTYFDNNYLVVSAKSGMFKHTQEEINFLVKNLPIKKNQKILDLCCGHGRHSLALAKKGFRVVGLDYSAYELREAQRAADKAAAEVKFIRADARNFDLHQKFDLILNLFTAFGYGRRQDDLRILKNVNRHLKPGGKFFIDVLSLPWLWRNYRPNQTQKLGPLKVEHARAFDFLRGANTETRKITLGKRQFIYHNTLRIYTLPEMVNLLASAGLKFISVWGGYRGQPYGLRTKRMMILAKKV